MTPEICSLNGELLPRTRATISVFNIEYSYGFGVYETLRVVNGTPYFLDQHSERLFSSAATIALDHPLNQNQLKTWIKSLCSEIGNETYNLKILLIGASKPEDVQYWILPLAPLFPDKKLYAEGATAITVEHERQFPQAKTLNMLGSYLAYRNARAQGCYDALLVDRDDNIREGTRTNFFMISGKTIIKPPVEQILDGVMQRFVLLVARANAYTVMEQSITINDLRSADGAFLTSTSSKLMPLRKIDELVFTIPESLRELQKIVDREYDALAHS